MSAAVQYRTLSNTFPTLTEWDAMRAISREAITATDWRRGLSGLAGISLRILGIAQIRIEEAFALSPTGILEWPPRPQDVGAGHVLASLSASNSTWGQLRVRFVISGFPAESPIGFVSYLAQQIAGMLNRLALEHQGALLSKRVATLRHRLKTRKAVHRASGLLAKRHGLSEQQALGLLFEYARAWRRNLYQVSEAVILGVDSDHPLFRRLAAAEPTTVSASSAPSRDVRIQSRYRPRLAGGRS